MLRAVERTDAIGQARRRTARYTTAKKDVVPLAGSVIPGEARLVTDLRHPEEPTLEAMKTALGEAVVHATRGRGVDIAVRQVWRETAVPFDIDCVELLEEAPYKLRPASRRMPSALSSNAPRLATVAPPRILPAPCAGGVRHDPAERVIREDAVAGAQVLLRAVEPWMAGLHAALGEPRP